MAPQGAGALPVDTGPFCSITLHPSEQPLLGRKQMQLPLHCTLKHWAGGDPFLWVTSTWMLENRAIAPITSSESRLQSIRCCELVNSISQILLKIQSVCGVGQQALRA